MSNPMRFAAWMQLICSAGLSSIGVLLISAVGMIRLANHGGAEDTKENFRNESLRSLFPISRRSRFLVLLLRALRASVVDLMRRHEFLRGRRRLAAGVDVFLE